jgi:hypothetical protein
VFDDCSDDALVDDEDNDDDDDDDVAIFRRIEAELAKTTTAAAAAAAATLQTVDDVRDAAAVNLQAVQAWTSPGAPRRMNAYDDGFDSHMSSDEDA